MKLENLLEQFYRIYGRNNERPMVYFAPGRVNLIGEHTDYNAGYVLPCALSLGTYCLVRPNKEDTIKLASHNMAFRSEIKVENLKQRIDKEWVNYPLGVINQFVEMECQIGGYDIYFAGNIPAGAGLSSSASIEMALATALNDLLKTELSPAKLALLSQKAENAFVGVQCGIMDQFAVALGKKNHAVFLNCNSLTYEHTPVGMFGYDIVIANTNKYRELASSKYNERRSQCETAVQQLSQGVLLRYLGEINLDTYQRLSHLVTDEVVRKRVQHVLTENQRVLDSVAALNKGELEQFGQLMYASHQSLRHDYEVTGIELDTLVEEASKINGVIGARMTGAGFGGCTVNIVQEENVAEFCSKVGEAYSRRTGLKADFYVADIGDGARKVLYDKY